MAAVDTSAAIDSGPFVIKKLSGSSATGTTISLAGRALPYRPYSLTGSQRHEMTWYPGSPIATVQFLGAEEDEATITGYWKDLFISDASAAGSTTQSPATLDGIGIPNAVALVQAVDNFRREGQLVQVSWMQTTRTGVLSKFVQKWHNVHDVEWEMTFKWISQQAETDSQIAVSAPAFDLNSASDQANADAQTLNDAAIPTVARRFDVTETIAANVNAVVGQAAQIAQTISNFVAGNIDPISSTLASIGILQQTIASTTEMVDDAYSMVDRAIVVGADTLSGIAAVPVGKCVAASQSQRNAVRAATQARRNAARSSAALLKQTSPDLVKTFYAKDGQDLRFVSNMFYGTPDGWQFLKTYNALSSSKLSAGQLVLVPNRFTGQTNGIGSQNSRSAT